MTTTTWTAPTNRDSGISSATINNAAGSLGSEIDGETNKDLFYRVTLLFTHGTAPAANTPWFIYFLTADDGTNYEDGGASLLPNRPPDAVVLAAALNSAQRKASSKNPSVPPFKHKALAWNATGQNATSVTLLLEAFSVAGT